MANVLNTAYPPELDTFMPAILVDQEEIYVFFSFSKYDTALASNINNIYIHYSLVDQTTNQSVLADPSGVTLSSITFGQSADGSSDRTRPYFTIKKDVLKNKTLKNNQYYKLQARFDISGKITNSGNGQLTINDGSVSLASYISNMENQKYFSEWSKVCLIRPIWTPKLSLIKFDESRLDDGVPLSFVRGIIPVVGHMDFIQPGTTTTSTTTTDNTQTDDDTSTEDTSSTGVDDKETERLQRYRIHVYNANGDDVYTTDWIMSGDNNQDPNSINYYMDLQSLNAESGMLYTMRIEYYTASQYYGYEDRDFKLAEYSTDTRFNPKITVCLDNEHGRANLHITNDISGVFGTLYVKRSDSRMNFKNWETLKVYVVGMRGSDVEGAIDIELTDDTISSMMWYRYSVQLEYSGGTFSPVFRSDVIIADFYDMHLKRLDMHVPIKYNYKISSFKPVVNRVKTDTLGGKYPIFAENANMDYKQFSISGLISMQTDDAEMFLKRKDWFGSQYTRYLDYKTYEPRTWFDNTDTLEELPMFSRLDKLNELIDVNDFVTLPGEPYSLDDSYDFFWEREFREELIKWLNDGEPKLYRSMTEGNMCVMITDISLTPNATLGRLVWDFTATAYEVEDGYSLDSLYKMGIIDIYTPISWALVGKKDNRAVANGGGSSYSGSDEAEGVDIVDISNPYISVSKPGQLYLCDLDDSRRYVTAPSAYGEVVGQLIGNQIQYRYGGGLSSAKPGSYYINNVKIYFLSEPHYFLQLTDGTLQRTVEGQLPLDAAPTYTNMPTNEINQDQKQAKLVLGYRFNYQNNDSSTSPKDIFVPYRPMERVGNELLPTYPANDEETARFASVNGYYQIPSNVNIKTLTFPDARQSGGTTQGSDLAGDNGDIVSIEYVINYREQSNTVIDTVGSVDVIRTIVGQYSELMEYGVDLHDDIYNKYEVIVTNADGSNIIYTEQLQYWRGICVDVDPYSLVDIKYYGESTYQSFLVGRSGVLHLLKDQQIDGIRFMGRQMFSSSSESLDEWEYNLESQTTYRTEHGRELDDKVINYFSKLSDIVSPIDNHVYRIASGIEPVTQEEKVKVVEEDKQEHEYTVDVWVNKDECYPAYIYYHGSWEKFSFIDEKAGIGVAQVAVKGIVDYYADVLRVRRS